MGNNWVRKQMEMEIVDIQSVAPLEYSKMNGPTDAEGAYNLLIERH